ncbi:MAG TPA: sortase [Candidatus Limnocylindrales bacterium]|nr:sortase [Candidatus Limnocylindrales bacterium]
MKRLSSWALPIILGVSGVVLIILGSLDLDGEPSPSLPPIAQPTPEATPSPTPDATETPDAVTPSPSPDEPTEEPTPTPLPDDVVAVQMEVPSVGVNVLVRQSTSAATDSFPPSDAAYILRSSSQPGRNASSYVFAHALNTLFKPLWNVQIGAEVLVRMSNDEILRYEVTEVRPNVPCPDPNADPAWNPPNPPLALQIHDDCTEGGFWTMPVDHERLTLQTSQGYNRNWGELVVVAKPIR